MLEIRSTNEKISLSEFQYVKKENKNTQTQP